MSISAVQLGVDALAGIGHAQYTPEQLLHILFRVDGSHRTEDISKGTIPAFFQGFLGDDGFDLVVGVEEVYAVQFALWPCNGN